MPSRNRLIASTAWALVALLLLRIASGGSLLGIVYVLRRGPPLMLVLGAAGLIGSVLLARDAWRQTTRFPAGRPVLAAILLIPFAVWLVSLGHQSGWLIAAAAMVAGVAELWSRPPSWVLDWLSGGEGR